VPVWTTISITVTAVTALEGVLLMVAVPLAILVVLGLLTAGPQFARRRRLAPGPAMMSHGHRLFTPGY
jgi:hypothetical protein